MYVIKVQILESGVLFATYTSDYLWSTAQFYNSNEGSSDELNFPESNDKFTFYIPLYFEILEKLIKIYREEKDRIIFARKDRHISDKYNKTKAKHISFSYVFEKELWKYLKLEVKDQKFYDELISSQKNLTICDVIDNSNDIILHPPVMTGEYVISQTKK